MNVSAHLHTSHEYLPSGNIYQIQPLIFNVKEYDEKNA